MKQVWKFSVATAPLGTAEIEMPVGAEVVHVGFQDSQLTIWALVDSDAKRKDHHQQTHVTEPRRFKVYGTGSGIREKAKHVWTWFDGPFVWHLFEITI